MSDDLHGRRLVLLLVLIMLTSSAGAAMSGTAMTGARLTEPADQRDSSHGANVSYGGHTYALIKARATWAQAQSAAAGKGGYLAIVGNASEDSFLLNMLISGGVRSTASDGGGAKYGWLGASDSSTEGVWVWNNGALLSSGYSHWGSGSMGSEPDDSGGQDCLALGMETWPVGVGHGQGFGDAGEWNDVDCGNTLAYIIEYNPPAPPFIGEVTLRPSLDEMTPIPHDASRRITGLEFDFTGGAMRNHDNGSLSQQQLTTNATSDNIIFTSNGLQLAFVGGGSGGIPGAGNGSLNITGTMGLQGNQSYDDIRISGVLNSSGPLLRLTANTITIESGGILNSNHTAGGPGQGAAGSATQTLSIGANGAAHIGSGGSGGGNSNSTNMSYGNGSEAGSQGGNVTTTSSAGNINVRSVGGLGGGVLILIARDLYINGSITASGGDGEDGPRPSNGGAGIAGAGGGSGGSVIIIADHIWWGQNGVISATGGDGGDGSNGARRQPISLLMYDGGDAGGGGGGGSVNISTTSNGIVGQPSISVAGGNGGTGGAPFGSGSHGRAGSAGAAGSSLTSTNFSGWGGSGGRALAGNWTSGALGTGGLAEGVTIRIGSVMPNGTSIDGSIRTTFDTGLSAIWSAWAPLNMTEHRLDRVRFLQLRFELNTTTNQTSPTITSISYEAWWWVALEGSQPLALSISENTTATRDWQVGDAGGVEPLLGNPVRLFHSDDFNLATNSAADPYTGSISISVPVDAEPDDGWILLLSDGVASPNTMTLSIGSTGLVTLDSQQYGQDIALPASELTTIWPTSGTIDASGLEWGELLLAWSADNRPLTGLFDELSIPWNLTHRVGAGGEFVTGIEAMVQSECGDWYHLRGCRDHFPLIATGISADVQFPITLSNLSVTSIDDIAPRVLDVWMEVAGSRTSTAEHGEMTTFWVTEELDESDLLIDCDLTAIDQSGGDQSGRMQWDARVDAYFIDLDSSLASVAGNETELDLTCDMKDAANNSANPSPTLRVTILPAPPEVSALLVNSSSGPLSGDSSSGTWLHDEALLFAVEETNDRSDLNVFLTLSQAGSPYVDVTLLWNASDSAYIGQWIGGLVHLGDWDVEVSAEDAMRGRQDADGLMTGVDATVSLVDLTAPELIDVTFDWAPDDNTAWRTSITWSAEPGETVHGWLYLFDESGVEIRKLYFLDMTSTTGHVDLDTSDLEPGRYWLEVTLHDASANNADDWREGMDGELIIEPPTELSILVLTPAEGDEFTVGDNVTLRIAISCNDGCPMSIEEAGLSGLSNGTIEFNRTLDEIGSIRYYFTLSSGDLTELAILNLSVVSPPVPQFASPVCDERPVEAAGGGREIVCSIDNIGESVALVRLSVLSADPFIACLPTVAASVPTNGTFVASCLAAGNVSEATTVSNAFAFEWQDVTGAWHRIGNIRQFSTSLEATALQDDDDSGAGGAAPSEASESGVPLGLAGAGALLVLVLFAGTGIMLRRRRDEDATPTDEAALSAADIGHPGGGHGEMFATGFEAMADHARAVAAATGHAGTYEQLPPGGRYQPVPEGLWYIDTDERWWWQEADGGWRRT